MRLSSSLLALAASILGCGASSLPPTTPAPTTSAAPEAWTTWRAARTQSLAGEDGWLTLVALCWLEGDELTIGSSDDVSCHLTEHAPPRLGRVIRREDGVHFVAEAGSVVTVGAEPITDTLLVSDATETYTVLEHGSLRMHLIDRGGRLGIRIKDRESAARLGFESVPVYDYDATRTASARFVPAAEGATAPIVNVLGMVIDEPIAGHLTFELGGTTHTLIAMPNGDAPEDGLFVMLRDATSGETTYGAGRYLDVPAPDASGATTLDFNFLETPPCGFTELATCPLPPPENELELPIEAGERWLGEH